LPSVKKRPVKSLLFLKNVERVMAFMPDNSIRRIAYYDIKGLRGLPEQKVAFY
jgi:hypothetical protein